MKATVSWQKGLGVEKRLVDYMKRHESPKQTLRSSVSTGHQNEVTIGKLTRR